MNEQKLRFRLGALVLVALVLLAVLITLFGSLPTLFQRHSAFTVRFRDATGVGAGTPVRRSGVRIGEVGTLQLDDASGEVRVEVLVRKQFNVRHNEQATLVQGLLGGDTTIDFLPKRQPENEPPLDSSAVEPGEELVGIRQANVSTLVGQAAEVVPSTQEALNEIRKSLQRLEKMSPIMEETLKEYRDLAKVSRDVVPELRRTNEEVQVAARSWNRVAEQINVLLQTNQDKLVKVIDNLNETLLRVSNVFNDENQKNLTTTLKNVKAGSEHFDSIAKNTDQLLRESQETIKRVNTGITQANDVLGNLQQATKPMAERSASVMKNLDESTAKFNHTMSDLQDVLRGLNQQDGALRKFLNDPAIYNNLNDAACMLVRIMPRVDRVLKDVEVFADKIARHPESLGIGGAVRPSAGLKEGPSAWSNPAGR